MSRLFADVYLDDNRLDGDISDDALPDMDDLFDFGAASHDPEGSRGLGARRTSRDAIPGVYRTQRPPDRGQSQSRDIPLDATDILSDDDDDDDGLFADGLADGLLDANAESEDEVAEEAEDVAQTQGKWKIDHSSGDHRLNGMSRRCADNLDRRVNSRYLVQDFIARTETTDFDGMQALEVLQRLHTIDYGSRQAGSSAADANDKYVPVFHLDFLSIVGLPLRPITRADGNFFDHVVITFKDWHQSYPAKHHFKIPFELEHRTFRLATASTRETWYIVMHPIVTPAMELLPRQKRLEKQTKSSKASALRIHHARALADHIKRVFQSGDFVGERVEASWNLSGTQSQKLTGTRWTTFQEQFVEDWPEHVSRHSYDAFWLENEPVFHAHDYGGNIEIEVSDGVEALGRETRLRPVEDSDGESDAGSLLDEGDDDREDGRLDDTRQRLTAARGTQDDWALNLSFDQDGLYSDGLKKLAKALDEKYDLDNVSSISYALAVDLNCQDATGANDADDLDDRPTWCLLGDRNAVQQEYKSSSGPSGMTFYPLAFHPAYGNFTSPGPPRFLQDHVLAVMKDNMSYQNAGAPVLSCDYFQAYSNVKRSIRYNPEDLLVTQGIATAALTLPDSEAKSSARVKATQQRLLRRLKGGSTPDDPDASRPLARERQRIEKAVAGNEFAFRMEQVVSLDVARLIPSRRNIRTVLRPIFQLMRFYLQEKEHYTRLLRRFRPTVFPQILGTFARVFELGTDEMLKRFQAQGSKGLGIALAEGVAALDRLGHYCFTGMAKVLVRSVLGPLKTVESLKKGAWPYLDPQLLDIRRGEGRLDVTRWPRSSDGRPIFMHIASLSFHYGPKVAASQHSLVWFRDLGGRSIRGPTSGTRFLDELFRDLWIPQMVAYVRHQVLRRLGSAADPDDDAAPDDLAQQQQRRDQVEEWAKAAHPFSWSQYEPMWRLAAPTAPRTMVSYKSRQDFAREVYQDCVRNRGAARQALSSLHSTWFAVLHAVFTFTSADRVSEKVWLSGLAAAMNSNQIECMPGSHRSRITYRRVVRFVGAVPLPRVTAARPGSLKRDAMEAELRVNQSRKRRAIDLGCEIPFTRIPPLVEDGFQALNKMFVKGDSKIQEHYQVARNCLEECLGDPLCDVLLMLVVTYGSSSVTPSVTTSGKGFEVGVRKNPAQFAANLATRMLWFLRPEAFPWEKDDGAVLRISEMTKKIEHKGVNNRFLREIGWVQAHGNRPNPRNSELSLRPVEELLRVRKELMSLRKDSAGFIARVFHSQDSVWVERCSEIVRERG
jgi:hypothetical protein